MAYVIAASVIHCVWSPNLIPFDPYKLASMMYLYDKKACGHTFITKSVKNLKISNDTMGLDVKPLRWTPAVVTVSSRLSSKTRKYMELSVVIHVFWMAITIAFVIITNHNKPPQLLTYALNIMFYMMIVVLIFDLSMAIFYVAHIKQSLTKGMIARYSGWSVEFQFENNDDFSGWVPMVASACWMRGIVVLALNIYSVRVLKIMRLKFKRKEIMKRFGESSNIPIPSAKDDETARKVLYYRPGEQKPYVKKFGLNF